MERDRHARAGGAAALIGRDAELKMLTEMIDNSPSHGGAILVVGDAGIGKSSILRAVAQHAREGGSRVLRTTGIQAESRLPFAGLHQLLHPLLPDADSLPPAQRRALATAFGLEDGPTPERFLIALAALTLITEAATDRPVTLVLDDVQWLDDATNEILSFLARRVLGDPVTMIAAMRAGNTARLADAEIPVLELHGLSDDAARDLLGAAASDLSASEQQLILGYAAGNPLALVELPTVWRSARRSGVVVPSGSMPLSARLERAFVHRVADLPAATRDALLIAAVDNDNELAEILAAASVLSGLPLTVAVFEPAERSGLIRFDEVQLHFGHPLVRSGILLSESPMRQQDANASLAQVLHDQPYRRAWHRAQAIVGPDDDVADELAASHTDSVRRGSVVGAITALERAAQLSTDSVVRGRRLLLAAEYAFGLGRADMVEELVSAAERVELPSLDQARAEWLRELFNDGVPGDANRVMALCATARQSAAVGDTDLALNLLLGAALRCWWAETGPDARAEVSRTTEALTTETTDARYVAALGVAEPVLNGSLVTRLLADIPPESVSDADALRLLGMAAHAIGDQPRAADYFERAESRLRSQGRLGLLPHVLGMQGSVHMDLGDWYRASSASEEGREIARDTGQPIWSTGTLVNDARSCGLMGRSARALELAAQAEHDLTLRALTDFLACVQLARGFAWITAGRHNDAFDALSRVFAAGDPSHHPREQFGGVMFLAEAAVHAGRVPAARETLAQMEQLAAITPSPLLHVQLLYARAVLAEDGDAEALYVAGLAADLVRWPWVRARIELAYGTWLRRQRRIAESRRFLRSASATLERIGASAWAEQARTELAATGESTGAPRLTTNPLSAQELQIARMAADGLSNREIGERLFLSPRTVGSHLYRIFPKLDITSRGQLSGRLSTLTIA